MTNNFFQIAFRCLLIIGVAPSAFAACTVNTTSLAFGNYSPFATSDKLGAGNVAVTCSLAQTYTIALSAGQGTFATRKMKSGTNVLTYNIYTDVTRLLVWGDGSGGTNTVGGVGTGLVANIPAYGKIPAQQNVKATSYTDSITVTVTF